MKLDAMTHRVWYLDNYPAVCLQRENENMATIRLLVFSPGGINKTMVTLCNVNAEWLTPREKTVAPLDEDDGEPCVVHHLRFRPIEDAPRGQLTQFSVFA